MDRPIELVPLVCIRCSSPLLAEPDEVAWVCTQCGQGQLLDDEKGLVALDVKFSARLAPNQKGKPFWVTMGQVTNLSRATYKSSSRTQEEAQAFWQVQRRFFIPAYATSLEDFLAQGTRLLTQPPELQDGPAGSFEPVTFHPVDIQAAADFIVVAIEAGRTDRLKTVEFTLELQAPSLWIL